MASEPVALRLLPGVPPPSTGTPVPLGASTPLRLDGHTGWWLVESGQVDIFAIALERGEPVGMRHPLCRIAAGELMAALPGDRDHTAIAVGHLGTSVTALTQADVATWPEARRAELLDRWLNRLATAVYGNAPAWPEIIPEPGTLLELPAGKRLFALRGALWVTPRLGAISIGEQHQTVTETLPIAAGLSVDAAEDATVEIAATADALARGIDAGGLERFHSVILSAVARRVAQDEETRRQRIAARAATDRRSLQWALGQLAEVGGGAVPRSGRLVSHDPAIAALAAAAAYQGVELLRTPRSTDGETAIRAFARVNGLALRQVLLRDTWWRRDFGPLIATRGEQRRPVAIIPDNRRGCRLWDPIDGSLIAVDEAIAAEIAPQALMTYRPMPQRVQGVTVLLGFAARGIGRELRTIIMATVLASALAALLPASMGFLFESAIPRAESSQVMLVILGLVLAGIGAGAFDLTMAFALLRLEGRLEMAMQPALVNRLLSLPVDFFRGFGTGELTNRVLSVQTIRSLLAGNTLISLLSALFAVSSFVVILLYSWLLAMLSGGLVIGAALISAALAYAELRQERVRVVLRGQEDSLIVQMIQGVAKLRVAASEARMFGLWAALFARQKRRLLTRQRYAGFGEIFNTTYSLIAFVVLFYAVSLLLGPGGYDRAALGLGGFLAINAAFGQLLAATTSLARASTTVLEVIPLFERLRPIVAAEPEARSDKTEPAPLSGRIEVSHVTFRYSEASHPTLDDLSLTIEPGSFVAIVGPSGSGKSTLLRLLLGFETPERGDILYDGQSLRTLDTVSLRRQIGVVLQHGRTATGSIFENITSGLPYTLDDAWAAARLAGLADEIKAMPMGMHTQLIEGSTALSGGQRQRLMIARALIGKPRLFLLDEATSALDNRSQAVVMRSLEQFRVTRLVVAHRLSTLEHADRIFVLEAGRLIEAGTFEELVARDGLFRRLVRRQTL